LWQLGARLEKEMLFKPSFLEIVRSVGLLTEPSVPEDLPEFDGIDSNNGFWPIFGI
jgi:hypothetical protein